MSEDDEGDTGGETPSEAGDSGTAMESQEAHDSGAPRPNADEEPPAEADESLRSEARANELAQSAGDAFRETTSSGPKTHRSSRPIDAGELGDGDDESLGGGPSMHVSEDSVDEVFAAVTTGDDDTDDGVTDTDEATGPDSTSSVDASPTTEPVAAADDPEPGTTDVSSTADDPDAVTSPESRPDDAPPEATGSGTDVGDGDASSSESVSADELADAIAAAENDTGDDFGRPKTEGASVRESSSDIGDVDLDVDDVEIGGPSSSGADGAGGAGGTGGAGGGVAGRGSTDEAAATGDSEVLAASSDAPGDGDAGSTGLLARLKSLLFG